MSDSWSNNKPCKVDKGPIFKPLETFTQNSIKHVVIIWETKVVLHCNWVAIGNVLIQKTAKGHSNTNSIHQQNLKFYSLTEPTDFYHHLNYFAAASFDCYVKHIKVFWGFQFYNEQNWTIELNDWQLLPFFNHIRVLA